MTGGIISYQAQCDYTSRLPSEIQSHTARMVDTAKATKKITQGGFMSEKRLLARKSQDEL